MKTQLVKATFCALGARFSILCGSAPALLATILLLLGSNAGIAQTTYTWNNASGGSWQTDANWNPSTGHPGNNSGDIAYLAGVGPFTITLDADEVLDRVVLGNDSVSLAASNITLDMNGFDIDALRTTASFGLSSFDARANATTGNVSMILTNSAGTTSTFDGGLTLIGPSAGVGVKSTVAVTGSNTVMTFNSDGITNPASAFNQIGRSGGGIGELFIESGAVLNITHSSLQVDGQANVATPSIIRVTGAGSEINAATAITSLSVDRIMTYVSTANADSFARLEVLDGGSFQTDDLVIALGSSGNSGTVLVSDPGSVLNTKRAIVSGIIFHGGQSPSPSSDAYGTLHIANGASATVSQSLTVFGLGTLIVDNATLGVTGSSALLSSGSDLELTLYNTAQPLPLDVTNALTITGANLNITLGTGFVAAENDIFTIAEFGSLTGTFAGLANLDQFSVGAYTFEIAYNASDITLMVMAIPIPEPSAASLVLFLGLAAVAVARRRRKYTARS